MATTKKTPRTTLAPAARETGTVQDYPVLLAEVKTRIQSAQYAALRAVNKELVGLYWDIGRLIVERQQTEGWGKGVVEQLSGDLRTAFPGVRVAAGEVDARCSVVVAGAPLSRPSGTLSHKGRGKSGVARAGK